MGGGKVNFSLSEEQLNMLSADMAALIGRIESIRPFIKEFDNIINRINSTSGVVEKISQEFRSREINLTTQAEKKFEQIIKQSMLNLENINKILQDTDFKSTEVISRIETFYQTISSIEGIDKAIKSSVNKGTEILVQSLENAITKIHEESQEKEERLYKANKDFEGVKFWSNLLTIGMSFSVFFLLVGFILGLSLNDTLKVNIENKYSFIESTNTPNEFLIDMNKVDLYANEETYLVTSKAPSIKENFESGLLYPYYRFGLYSYLIFFVFFAASMYVTYVVTKKVYLKSK